jgi:multidrug efflux pump subunit AcrA (membrane-fusion protein)
MPKMFKKWYFVAGAVVLLLFFVTLPLRKKVTMEINAFQAKRGNITAVVSVPGTVKAIIIRPGAKIVGKVIEFKAQEGERVNKGQVLVKLDAYNQAYADFIRADKLMRRGSISKREYENYKEALNNTIITAPIAGIMTQKMVQTGEVVAPGSTVATIIDPKHRWLEVQIDLVDIALVRKGQKISITSDSYPSKVFTGKLTKVIEQAELKKTGDRIKIDEDSLVCRGSAVFYDPKEELKTSMMVDVDIVVAEKTGVLLVPREAITVRQGDTCVFVIENKHKTMKRIVNLGARDFDNVEVLSGLKDAETVAVSNVEKLKDKGRVKIVPK